MQLSILLDRSIRFVDGVLDKLELSFDFSLPHLKRSVFKLNPLSFLLPYAFEILSFSVQLCSPCENLRLELFKVTINDLSDFSFDSLFNPLEIAHSTPGIDDSPLYIMGLVH